MMRPSSLPLLGLLLGTLTLPSGCSSDDSDGTPPPATGGASSQGGSSTGGASGAKSTGGTLSTTGGTLSTTGGAPTPTGGKLGASGGASGSSSGGSNTGGAVGGGGATAGSGGSTAKGGGGATAKGGSGGGLGGAGGSGIAGAGGAGAGMAGSGGSGGSGTGTGKSAGCGKAPTIASNKYNNGQHISITAGGMQRRYILNVPTNYDNTKPYKLVIAYHQLNGNAEQMYQAQYYHLLPLSNNTTIFVAPNGQKNNADCSDASNCGWQNPQGTDIALADAIVAELGENFCIDTNRIFATGWSYGGSMSYKTACERPLGAEKGYIRAIAAYSGAQLSGNCTPSKAVAYFGAHGTRDSVLGHSMGVGLAQNFAKANGCTWAAPTAVNSGAHVCTDEKGCAPGYPVRFCSFNGDHTPDPDSGQAGKSWVYQEVWDFFSQF